MVLEECSSPISVGGCLGACDDSSWRSLRRVSDGTPRRWKRIELVKFAAALYEDQRRVDIYIYWRVSHFFVSCNASLFLLTSNPIYRLLQLLQQTSVSKNENFLIHCWWIAQLGARSDKIFLLVSQFDTQRQLNRRCEALGLTQLRSGKRRAPYSLLFVVYIYKSTLHDREKGADEFSDMWA